MKRRDKQTRKSHKFWLWNLRRISVVNENFREKNLIKSTLMFFLK